MGGRFYMKRTLINFALRTAELQKSAPDGLGQGALTRQTF